MLLNLLDVKILNYLIIESIKFQKDVKAEVVDKLTADQFTLAVGISLGLYLIHSNPRIKRSIDNFHFKFDKNNRSCFSENTNRHVSSFFINFYNSLIQSGAALPNAATPKHIREAIEEAEAVSYF